MKTLLRTLFLFFVLHQTSKAQAPVISNIAGIPFVCSNPAPGNTYSVFASNSPTSYTWAVSPSTGVLSVGTGSVRAFFFPNTNLNYTISVLASNASGESAIFTYTVQVFETPTVTFSGAYFSCQGSATNLSATSTLIHSASSSMSYSWSPSTGLSNTTGPNVTANPGVTTTYTLQLMLGFCSNTYQTTVFVQPSPNISVNSSPNIICNGESAVVTLTSDAMLNYFNFLPMNALTTLVSPTVTTTYTLSGRTGNCQTFVQLTQNVSACVGINDASAGYFENLSVYPNPSLGTFIIKSPRSEKINICNELGQIIMQVNLIANEETEIREIPPGVYFMAGRGAYTKIVVTR